jgi:SOS response regulatory protein OraA/RecX
MTTKNKALGLLAKQPYTVKRLTQKLLEKGFPQDEIADVTEWCIGMGYLNDAEWAERKTLQKAAKGWDKRKIAAYLRHYGVGRCDITDALNGLETDGYEED